MNAVALRELRASLSFERHVEDCSRVIVGISNIAWKQQPFHMTGLPANHPHSTHTPPPCPSTAHRAPKYPSLFTALSLRPTHYISHRQRDWRVVDAILH